MPASRVAPASLLALLAVRKVESPVTALADM
jgi:hypothetical protein